MYALLFFQFIGVHIDLSLPILPTLLMLLLLSSNRAKAAARAFSRRSVRLSFTVAVDVVAI